MVLVHLFWEESKENQTILIPRTIAVYSGVCGEERGTFMGSNRMHPVLKTKSVTNQSDTYTKLKSWCTISECSTCNIYRI